MKLGEIGEDRLLAQLLPALSRNNSVVLGAGDDCAIVRGPKRGQLQLLKTDCIVEGIHFAPATDPAKPRPLFASPATPGRPHSSPSSTPVSC